MRRLIVLVRAGVNFVCVFCDEMTDPARTSNIMGCPFGQPTPSPPEDEVVWLGGRGGGMHEEDR